MRSFPPSSAWRPLLELALAEDLGDGDRTSELVIAPDRRGDLARLGLRAMIAGAMASFMTATIAGMLL